MTIQAGVQILADSGPDGTNFFETADQLSTTGDTTGFVAGSGTASKDDSVYAGSSGSTAYTVGDIVTALKSIGVLAA